MEQLKPALKRKPVQILWIVLSCIPFFNWIGFLVLGNATNQKKWTILGYVHFALSLASASLFASYVVNYDYLVNPHNDFDKLFPYLMFVSWLVGVVQAWWISGEAKKRLERQFSALTGNPTIPLVNVTRAELVRSSLGFILLALIPISGLGLVHIGKTIKRRKLQVLGWVSFALCLLLEITCIILFSGHHPLYSEGDPLFPFFIVITQMPVLLLWVIALLHWNNSNSENSYSFREYTLVLVEKQRQKKQAYEQMKLLYPCLQSTAWKIKHSIHLLWCLPLITSPIALIHIGISDRKWKRLACGIGSLLYYSIFVLYVYILFVKGFDLLWLNYTLTFLFPALWIAIIWFSIASLQSHLIYAAERCGGYVDSFDAEQARLEQTAQISAPEGEEQKE